MSRKKWGSVVVPILMLAIAGCLGPGMARPELAAKSPGSDQPSVAIPSASLKIARAFFESSLEGKLTVSESGSESRDFSSALSWVELPSTEPLPPGAGTVLADFRDHPGCARFSDYRGVSVCFTVVPDLSSLEVTRDKVSLLLDEGLPGYPDIQSLVLCQATRDSQSLTLVFDGTSSGNAVTIQARIAVLSQ